VTGLWLASYLVLWGLVVVACLLLVGGLRQIGLLQRQIERRAAESDAATLEQDGPAIGSHLPDLVAETINGFGSVTLAPPYNRGGTLLVFMTALCESCQHIVEPLNALAGEDVHDVRPFVIMQDDDHACRAFLRVFSLRLPLICDGDHAITGMFAVRRASFALLYDGQGMLVRKGGVEMEDDLLALLGRAPTPRQTQAPAFPQLA